MTPPPQPVTVVGLGPMGTALAEAFLAGAHPTTIWNRTAAKADPLVAKGARRADTIVDAVSASSLVIVCLADYEAMHQVLDPALDALSGRVVVNLCSGTPEQAREAAVRAAAHDIRYLDGAIMVPIPSVGQPESVLLFSGPRETFDATEPALTVMGGAATHLGADPGLAVLYNTALLGMMFAAVNGFLHAAALVGTAGVTTTEFGTIALDWFLDSVVGEILRRQAPVIDAGRFGGELGTMEMNLTAIDHVLRTSEAAGIGVDVPRFLKAITERAIAAGHGGESYMSMIEFHREPTPTPA